MLHWCNMFSLSLHPVKTGTWDGSDILNKNSKVHSVDCFRLSLLLVRHEQTFVCTALNTQAYLLLLNHLTSLEKHDKFNSFIYSGYFFYKKGCNVRTCMSKALCRYRLESLNKMYFLYSFKMVLWSFCVSVHSDFCGQSFLIFGCEILMKFTNTWQLSLLEMTQYVQCFDL